MLKTSNSETIEPFINQPIEKLAGIYFENLAHLHFYRDHWKFINYVNLIPEERERTLQFYMTKIEFYCYSMYGQDILCSGFPELQRLQRKLESLKSDIETINDLIGQSDVITKNINKRRIKRDVSDFVGQISKILFGTLDSTDADYYNKQIDLVYNNSKQLTDLYKKQVSIIKSTIGKFSDVFRANNEKFKEIDFNFYTLHRKISNNTFKITEIQLNTKVNSYLIECSEMLLEYELELEILTDAILLARRGLIHPKILTPKELFNNLKASQYTLDGKRLPVALDPSEFTNLIDASNINIFYKNHRLTYIIEIPLIEQSNFTLYHVIPLPIKQSERELYAFINPTYTYLGLSSDKQLYTHITELELSKCKSINDVKICKQTDLYQVSAIHNCESELLKSARLESILAKCDVRVMKIYNTVWYQLKTINSWLYTAPRNETLHISCKDNKPRQTQLFSTGFIRLSTECDATSDNALLHSQTARVVSTMNKNYIPNVNLNISKLYEDLKKQDVNVSELHLLNIEKTPNIDIHLLKTASSTLDEIYKEADVLGKHHHMETLHQKVIREFYYSSYTVVGLVILYVTIRYSLISKYISVIKIYCVLKEYAQYFSKYFNNNTKIRSHPPNDPQHVIYVIPNET